MATKAVTFRVDDTIKKEAETMLEDIGMNMTTYIVSSLKALVRERKIPFELVTAQYLNDQIILEKLAAAETEATDPKTKWLEHEEVFGEIREKYGYDI